MAVASAQLKSADRPSENSLSADFTASGIVAIDDDPMTLRLLGAHLYKAGLNLKTATSGRQGLELITDDTTAVILDLKLPDLTGFEILDFLQKNHPTVQVIVLTGSDEVQHAVQAMRAGASHYLTKPFDPQELLVYVEKAISSQQIVDENRSLKQSYSQNLQVRVLASSGDMHGRLIQQVNQIAALDSTVFIGGETGTGKSTVARMIHQRSARSAGPFVTVNCASLPRDLIQSELFGHTKGAFTGAIADRLGHAEVADGGTLFLDEIGDLPLELQPKLLTFLQDRTVQRLGATAGRQVDVRLVTATHHDLAALCRQGTFRQDLYFRLLVLNLELPALRHRVGELMGIAENILSAICQRQSLKSKTLANSAKKQLEAHTWPGNIRELENVLERAVAYSTSSRIEADDLRFSDQRLHAETTTASVSRPAEIGRSGFVLAGKTMEEIEREAIIQTLKMTGGNKSKSARMLGISEKSIYNKMKRLKIEL